MFHEEVVEINTLIALLLTETTLQYRSLLTEERDLCACVRACVRACARARARVCVCVCVCVRAPEHEINDHTYFIFIFKEHVKNTKLMQLKSKWTRFTSVFKL